jgi:hypothetical protein
MHVKKLAADIGKNATVEHVGLDLQQFQRRQIV